MSQKGASMQPKYALEVDIIPVNDVERSKQFYQRLGWRLDDDVEPGARCRVSPQ